MAELSRFDRTRQVLLAALDEVRWALEQENPPHSISFQIPFDRVGRPKKAIWRAEGERDLTGTPTRQ